MGIILYIVLGGLVGVLCSYLFARLLKKKSIPNSSQEDGEQSEEYPQVLKLELEQAKEQLSKKEKRIESLNQELEKAREVYERLRTATIEQLGKEEAQELFAQDEELRRLKKTIKDLEEDIDDLEDERDSIKKKIEEKETELGKKEQQIRTLEKEQKSLTEAISTLETENKKSNDALDLVDKLLKAKSADDQKSGDQDKLMAIDSFAEFIETTCLPLLKELQGNSAEDQRPLLKRWVADKKKVWLDKKTTISFIGEFSAGKTTIVNRLLEIDSKSASSSEKKNMLQLATGSKPETAIPTYISYGDFTALHFITPDDKKKKIEPSTFDSIKKDTIEKFNGVSSLIKYFVIGYKHERLRGLSILDTPGFSSNNEEDAQRTAEVINESDALFWVLDVNTGEFNQSSLDIVKKYITKPIYVILNKADQKSETEVNQVKAQVEKTLKKNGLAYNEILSFSKDASLDSLQKLIDSVGRAKDRRDFLDSLLESLQKFETEWNAKQKTGKGLVDKSDKALKESTSKIEEYQEEIEKGCNRLKEIPEHNSGFLFFTRERYEMSVEQMNDFRKILTNLSGDSEDESQMGVVGALVEESETLKNRAIELETAKDKLSSVNEYYKRIKDCINKIEAYQYGKTEQKKSKNK